ncbi:hypothetical protein nbrc107696_12700 [Gordonia spumicola]|uniref:non-specific serine/threonine protein kinase n=2 Tax=Gordonia spumicola TaxID=589161 RepID=A0A7I9V6I1_9ACTN|nr:hypothetical protein nbrc107696_12700 [Gordonia spumicola]
MGEVYEAVDTSKDRTVALKLLPPHLADDAEFRARFMRESQTVARLNDPHVIPIHDFGEIDGLLFLDMRIVHGRDLRSMLSAGALPADRAVALITQIAGALDSAHASGLLHRDVKPENILVDANDFAYLVDFGIAQSVGATRLTATGAAIGSFVYMAPERFGETVDLTPASDVYSLACVLFEAVTGVPPFSSTSYEQLITGHLTRPVPPTGTVLDPVIAAGTVKDPAGRTSSCREFAAAANAMLTGGRPPTPIPVAHPAPTVPATSHRGRTSMIAAAVAIAALLAGAGAVWFAVQASSPDPTPTAASSAPPTTTTPPPTQATTTVTQTQVLTPDPTVTAVTPASADLGLSTPISRPPCDGRTILIVASVTTPGEYAQGVARALADNPGAEYLRTDESCSSLRQSLNGNPIYAVYFEGDSLADTCALHARMGSSTNARRLDDSTPPNTNIC